MGNEKMMGRYMDILSDYEKVKDRLYVRLSNYYMHREMIDKSPHIRIIDLAVTYHVLLEDGPNEVVSALVDNSLFSLYGVSLEKLNDDAMLSTVRNYDTKFGTMKEITGMDLDSPFHIVTNDKARYGAAVLFYPGMLELIYNELGDDFFIIPSSVHEVLVLQKEFGIEKGDLAKMVRTVNSTQVAPDDVLSDHVYEYIHESEEVRIAA